MPAVPFKSALFHCGPNDILHQGIQINWLPLRALKHQPSARGPQPLAVQIEPFLELGDDGNGRPTLSSLWLLAMASPVRLRNSNLLAIVVFPTKASQFALAYSGKRSYCHNRCGGLRENAKHPGDLLERISIS